MAVYHFHAKYKDAHDCTYSVDGLDGEFGEGVRVEGVQILSLTRISG